MQLRNRRLQSNQRRVVGPNDDTDIESSDSEYSYNSDYNQPDLRFKKTYTARNKIFDRKGIYVPEVNDTWAVDLIDFSKVDPSFYVLNVVDIFSRKAESVKLNGKSAEVLEKGFIIIFEKFGAKPKRIWTDLEGGVWKLEKWFLAKGIKLYTLNNSYLGPNTHSSPIAERFNRTMRQYMMKLKSKNLALNFNQLMAKTVNEFIPYYNNKIHSTIKAKPNDVYEGDEPIYKTKVQHLRNFNRPRVSLKPYKVGDEVLLQKNFKNPIVDKKDTTYYERVYKIEKVKLTNPITYELNGVKGSFYRNQLKLA